MPSRRQHRSGAIKARAAALLPWVRDPASLRPQPARSGTDYWATPQCLTRALADEVLPSLPPAPVWECAAGDGRLANAMRAAGRVVVASDIEPRGPDIERRDFLHDPPLCGQIALTNPPFSALDSFIARGLQWLDTGKLAGLVLLVRWDALTAACRAGAFHRAARFRFHPSFRLDFRLTVSPLHRDS